MVQNGFGSLHDTHLASISLVIGEWGGEGGK